MNYDDTNSRKLQIGDVVNGKTDIFESTNGRQMPAGDEIDGKTITPNFYGCYWRPFTASEKGEAMAQPPSEEQTPRVDAEVKPQIHPGYGSLAQPKMQEQVSADFARTIERELWIIGAIVADLSPEQLAKPMEVVRSVESYAEEKLQTERELIESKDNQVFGWDAARKAQAELTAAQAERDAARKELDEAKKERAAYKAGCESAKRDAAQWYGHYQLNQTEKINMRVDLVGLQKERETVRRHTAEVQAELARVSAELADEKQFSAGLDGNRIAAEDEIKRLEAENANLSAGAAAMHSSIKSIQDISANAQNVVETESMLQALESICGETIVALDSDAGRDFIPRSELAKLEAENIRRIKHLNRLGTWAQQDPTGPLTDYMGAKVQSWVLNEIRCALGAESTDQSWQPDFIPRSSAIKREVFENLVRQCDVTNWMGIAGAMATVLDAARAELKRTEVKP